MDAPTPEKLTKKQRKALAFRERKGKRTADDVEQLDVPETDIIPDSEEIVPPTPAKRKRDDDEPTPGAKKAKKDPAEPPASKAKPKVEGKKNHRYILFVGNLSYKTTLESIQAHFASCPDAPTVRLLTPKPNASRPGTSAPNIKSKGCAFLEFPKSASLQHALTLHHSELDGRVINVELTSGGGGSGEKRRETLKGKNKALEEEREQVRKFKEAKGTLPAATPSTNASWGSRAPKSAIRHSTTSGTEPFAAQASGPKTWSVPVDGEKAGRGGEKHKKKTRGARGVKGGREKTQKAWAPSGANAVSVG